MTGIRYRIDSYSVQIFSKDSKGRRKRWGDRIIHLYSDGREVAQAVFAKPGEKVLEPYVSNGKIFYFAESDQSSDVINLLRTERSVHIAWEPVHDPREPNDGDAYFYTVADESS
jgi:hypothetical protein